MPQISPHALTAITQSPSRRSRSELVLRELTFSSYPHALLGNLAIAIAEQAEYDEAELQSVAAQFREAEDTYSILDFIRCVELKRNLNEIVIIIKSLKIQLDNAVIDDDRKHHEYMASGTIELPSADYQFKEPLKIAELMLRAFYQTQSRNKRFDPSFEASTLISRMKTPLVCPQGDQRSFSFNDEVVSMDKALEMMVESLNEPKFQFIMTHNTLFLQNQKKRLWGLNRQAKHK